tara:strand:+ start:218 stop:1048 length:831 start_codon:yes stop_codon:yes gene_type:complete
MLNKFDLSSKTALITGGAGMLGIEHASALLEINANVVITDICKNSLDQAKELLSEDYNSSKIITKLMDVSLLEDITKVHGELIQEDSHVDILINNAAIDPKVTTQDNLKNSSRLENFSLQEWDKQISVGLTGAFLCSKIFGTAMAEHISNGVILNIASDLSVFSPDQRLYRKEGLSEKDQPVKPVTYSVIKSGLIGLTKYLSTYWADKGVRSNALSPGGVYTDQDEEFVRRLSSLIPLGRMANKDEYRSAVQFLSSDASLYLNGQNIVIDGGRSTW